MRCSCLKVAHSRELKSSLKNKDQDWTQRERGENSSFGSQEGVSCFLSGQWPKGVGGDYSPPQKESLVGFPPDKSGDCLVMTGQSC
jgi:hypothetical protein